METVTLTIDEFDVDEFDVDVFIDHEWQGRQDEPEAEMVK